MINVIKRFSFTYRAGQGALSSVLNVYKFISQKRSTPIGSALLLLLQLINRAAETFHTYTYRYVFSYQHPCLSLHRVIAVFWYSLFLSGAVMFQRIILNLWKSFRLILLCPNILAFRSCLLLGTDIFFETS